MVRLPASGQPTGAQGADGAALDDGVEGNSRLTAATAAVLFVLFAAEGVTVLQIRSLLTLHVFIGMLMIPPVLLKMATTSYRFVRYYRGAPAYLRKGAPPALLRFLGPFVVATTVAVLASGVALLLAPASARRELLFAHKATFVLWFGAMAVHVLAHLVETARIAPRDWWRATGHRVRGASARQWVVVASLAAGIPLGLLFLDRVGPWLRLTPHAHVG